MFWRPEVAPAAVVLLAPATPFSVESLLLKSEVRGTRKAEEGAYVQLAGGPQVLLLGGAGIGDELTVVLPFDRFFAERILAAEALRRCAGSAGRPREDWSAQRRQRLKRMLRALDGRALGASYRDVSAWVLGERFAESLAWRTSAARAVAIRLCRGAAALVRGGYLAMLRRRR